MDSDNKNVKGFTLVELLVVISIIALLVSILLPALNKARDQAKLLLCKTNLRQQGIAFQTYALDNNGAMVPGNYMMGHDIWGMPSENSTGGTDNRPINLGYLLAADSLPLPSSPDHPFYCSAMEAGNHQPDPAGFKYASTPTVASFEKRGFDGWGINSRAVNIGYDYRDTIDDGDNTIFPGWSFWDSDLTVTGVRLLDKASKLSLVCDVVGMAQFTHKNVYNFVRGDSSVDAFVDTEFQLREVHSTRSQGVYDAFIFDALDNPWKIPELLFGS